jgi:hypothetical protein
MSYAFVKVTELRSNTGTTASGSVTSTAANLLTGQAGCYVSGGAATTLTVSGGGTWTSDASAVSTIPASGTDKLSAVIASAPSATGGAQTITFTRSAGTLGVIGFVTEFSGNPTTGVRDATSPAVKTGTSAAASANSLSNVTANAVFVSFVVDDDSTSPSTVTATGTGWTIPAGGKETDGVNFLPSAMGYKIVSATGLETSPFTVTSSHWGELIAVYKAAGGGATFNPGWAYGATSGVIGTGVF